MGKVAESPRGEEAESVAVILVVEDEIVVRLSIAEHLREQGYSVVEAVGIADAVAVFSSGTSIDFVFSDTDMPGAHSGLYLADWLSKHHPTVPILLASSEPSLRPELTTGKVRRFIAKPYAIADISVHMKQMLSRG
jgi:CheY-like chemotaxis protein